MAGIATAATVGTAAAATAGTAAAAGTAAGVAGTAAGTAAGAAGAAKGAGILAKIFGGGGGALDKAKSGAGAIMGGVNLVKGFFNKRKRDAMTPASESPQERQILNALRRKRRALETGTAGPGLNLARRMGASALRNSFKAGGGANLGQIAMLQSQAFNNMAGRNAQEENQLLALEQKQLNRMAGVSRDLDLLQRAELSADAANEQKDGTSGLMTGMS